ncbi:PRC-barrel domain-containing protein [Helicobacter sp. 23-1045]
MQNRCRGDLGESNANLTLDSRESSGDLCDSHNLNADDFGILVAKCGKTIGLKGEIRLIIYSDFDEIFTKGNVFLARDSAHDSRHTKQTTTRHCEAFERSENNEAIHESKNGWLLRFARKSCGLPRLGCVKSRKTRQSRSFFSNDGLFLTLKSFNPHKKSATFDEIQSIDNAKNLTSLLLYSSESLSQKYCALSENEHFWFEIIGMRVVENDEIIGIVSDIERIGSVDYLIVAVSAEICAKYPHIKAKKFYIPYISRYILRVEKGANLPQDSQDSPESKGNIFTQDSLGILENS